jgi:hypothetical protein
MHLKLKAIEIIVRVINIQSLMLVSLKLLHLPAGKQ